MNRTVAVVVIIIVLLGLGWKFFKSPKTDTNNVTPDTTQATSTGTKTNTSTSSSNTQTTQSLITQKGSYECIFTQASTTGQSTNLIYIADGKLRGEFRDVDAVGNLMLYDGINLYVWQEGKTVGTKTRLTSLSQLPSIIPRDLTSGSSLGSGLNSAGWDCHQWIKKANLLVPPTQVRFTAN